MEESNIQEETHFLVFGVNDSIRVPIVNADQLIENVKDKIENEKGIAKNKQRLYYEGEPLQDVLQGGQEFRGRDILFVKNSDNPTQEMNWTVDVYGNSNGSLFKVTVSVPYSSYLTDLGLKKLVHQEKDTLPVANQTLYHEGGDVLPKGKPLKTCEFWNNRVILFVEDADNPTTERDWSIVVCGDFDESRITVSVSFPSSTPVDLLKKSIENKIKVPINEQTLYYKGEILEDEKSLFKCNGMKNGAAVYLAIKPIKVNIYRPDVDFL